MTAYRAAPAGMEAGAIVRAVVAFMAALALPGAIAMTFDDRTLFGVNVWDKPLRFDLALGVHLLTLRVLLCLLAPTRRARAAIRRASALCTVCAVLEALYVTLQAARGRASHFNVQTPLEQFLY